MKEEPKPDRASEALEARGLRVARLSYLNVFPFFLADGPAPMLSAHPRKLGEEAAAGRIDAGPFSLVDAWRLEAEFEPLGDLGIAARGPARSVLLFSKKPMEELGGACIGVTEQSATSVKLLTVLLELRDGVRARMREDFALDDEARLLIGDDALTHANEERAVFPWVFDLGREWYIWRERPFVFCKWMVRRSASRARKDELLGRLEASLRKFEKAPDMAAQRAAESYPLPATRILNYLTGYAYRLGPSEKEAEDVFRSLLSGLYRPG